MTSKDFILRDEEKFNNLFQYGGIAIPYTNRGLILKTYFEAHFGKGAKAIEDGEWQFPVNTGFDNFRKISLPSEDDKKGFLIKKM